MKIIHRTKKAYQVEHDGLRYDIPKEIMTQYNAGLLTVDELMAQALPVSWPWAEFIKVTVTPEQIEAELHRHGIHTLDDLSKRMRAAQGAIQKAVGISPASIHRRASEKIKK